MSLPAITAPPPGPAPGVTPIRPVPAPGPAGGDVLGPAVSLRIGPDAAGAPAASNGKTVQARPEAESRGYVRDAESRSLVFQVVDPASGDIVVQIPDAVVLKARAYAREAAASLAANPAARPGTAVEKRV
ncbi:hypothetical protein [uncultured Methylobacterium sp.]|uniref:hypothetical protein n=1 Tax=uncultured Methylobacterium sp. TaxID=157278 RepID=UPI0035CA9A24